MMQTLDAAAQRKMAAWRQQVDETLMQAYSALRLEDGYTEDEARIVGQALSVLAPIMPDGVETSLRKPPSRS